MESLGLIAFFLGLWFWLSFTWSCGSTECVRKIGVRRSKRRTPMRTSL